MTKLLADDTDNGTGTILLVVTAQGDGLTSLGRQRQLNILLLKQFQQSLQVDVEDLRHGLVGDW